MFFAGALHIVQLQSIICFSCQKLPLHDSLIDMNLVRNSTPDLSRAHHVKIVKELAWAVPLYKRTASQSPQLGKDSVRQILSVFQALH
jgi:hypothetical protein